VHNTNPDFQSTSLLLSEKSSVFHCIKNNCEELVRNLLSEATARQQGKTKPALERTCCATPFGRAGRCCVCTQAESPGNKQREQRQAAFRNGPADPHKVRRFIYLTISCFW